MKKPNAYLQKREAEKQTLLDVGEQFGMQKMWDYIQIVEIYGDKALPFYERYPEMKRITYDKPRKGWN